MALPKLDPVDLHYLDLWLSNIADVINYDLGKIEVAVPTLSMILTNIDTPPIQYLRDSLEKLVDNVNNGFEQIDERLKKMESQMTAGGR